MEVDRSRSVLVVNTKSRRGRSWFEEAQVQLKSDGINLEAALSFRSIDELISATRAAISRKIPLIIVGGGDGTFSAIARFFVGSPSTLGVLPLGTGNAFARDLGIRADVRQACDVIANGKASQVDLACVGDRHFLNVATLGVTTGIARELTDTNKQRLGRFVYAVAVIRALRGAKPFRVDLDTENGQIEFDTLQVVIGNGRFHAGPFPIAPDASITQGKLILYALKNPSKMTFLRYALHLPGGRHVDLPDVHSEHTIGGVLTTSPIRHLTVDGEICGTTPLKFSTKPRCLPVLTPLDFQG